MTDLKVIADVKDLGKVVEVAVAFDAELKQLSQGNARLISPRDEAYARLQTRGKEKIGKSYGTWATAGFEYAKEQLPVLRLRSRLLNQRLAKKAVQENRQGRYFHTDSTEEYETSAEQAEKDKEKDPEKRKVLVLPSITKFTISDKDNWEIYQAILKDQAKPYFELNGPITIYPVGVREVDSQDGTLMTQMWFSGLGVRSGLGGGRGLGCVCWARGVLKTGRASRVAVGSQTKLPYTSKQLDKNSRIVQGVRTGELPASKLEQVEEFLGGLKQ